MSASAGRLRHHLKRPARLHQLPTEERDDQPGAIIRLADPSQTALLPGLNGQAVYAGTDATLYQVVLHEIGHALGLADDADPRSVLFASASGSNQTLDQTDVSGVQALYGVVSSQGANSSTSSQPTGILGSSELSPVVAPVNQNAGADGGLNQMIQAMAGMTSSSAGALSSPLVPQATASTPQLAGAINQGAKLITGVDLAVRLGEVTIRRLQEARLDTTLSINLILSVGRLPRPRPLLSESNTRSSGE